MQKIQKNIVIGEIVQTDLIISKVHIMTLVLRKLNMSKKKKIINV